MAIEVSPRFRTTMLDDPAWIVVNVRADPDLAGEALQRATPELRALRGVLKSGLGEDAGWTDGPKEVFGVSYTPDGAMLVIDGGGAPDDVLARIPDVVAQHLVEVGVEDATIGAPMRTGGPVTNGGLGHQLGRLVAADLHPAPGGWEPTLPLEVAQAAAQWVCGDLSDDDLVWSCAQDTEFSVPVGAVPDLVETAGRRGSDVFLLAGRPPSWPPGNRYPPKGWSYERMIADAAQRLGGRIRLVRVAFGKAHRAHMQLWAGGPATSDDELIGWGSEFIQLLRRFAGQTAYSYVSISSGRPLASRPTEWHASGGQPAYLLQHLCEEFVFDAFPYQVLGPGHLVRLGGTPPGAEPLDSGRVGLAVDRLDEWLAAPSWIDESGWHLRPDAVPGVRQAGWQLLAPCLPRDDERLPHRPPPSKDAAPAVLVTQADGAGRSSELGDEPASWVPLGEGRRRPRPGQKPAQPVPIARPVRPSEASGQWSTVAPLPTPRARLAVATAYGRIYAIGGSNSAGLPLNTVEAYDEVSDRWEGAAPLPKPRSDVSAATGPDGRIYVVGFNDEAEWQGAVDVYDPISDRWDEAARVPVLTRSGWSMATGTDGLIYLFGGIVSSEGPPLTYLGTVQQFDTSSGAWIKVGSFPTPRAGFALATGGDGRLYLVGGMAPYSAMATTETYDPLEDAWEEMQPLTFGRYNHAVVAGPDGCIYATGGSAAPTRFPSDTAERYDPSKNQWSNVAALASERHFHVSAVGARSVYVLGGASQRRLLKDVEALLISG